MCSKVIFGTQSVLYSENMSKEFDLEKLRVSENFHTWCFAMENLIDYKAWSGCITSPPTEKDDKKLLACKAFLVLNVDPRIYVHIKSCISASETWSTLKRLFEDKGLSRVIEGFDISQTRRL